MKVSHGERLAIDIGLQRRGGWDNRSVLSVAAGSYLIPGPQPPFSDSLFVRLAGKLDPAKLLFSNPRETILSAAGYLIFSKSASTMVATGQIVADRSIKRRLGFGDGRTDHQIVGPFFGEQVRFGTGAADLPTVQSLGARIADGMV